jgi:hypothetical protein
MVTVIKPPYLLRWLERLPLVKPVNGYKNKEVGAATGRESGQILPGRINPASANQPISLAGSGTSLGKGMRRTATNRLSA